MKRFCILLLMIFIISVQGYTTPEVKKIIVFNSYHEGFPWTDGITSAIKKYFTLSDIKPELYFEYLDRKRFSDKTYIKLLPDLFFMKYRDTGIDLIIATDDDALDFLREHEKKLFPSVPVVYTGINNLVIPDIVDGRRYTGILEETPPDGTVNLIRRLHPLVNHVYVIADFGTTGRARTGSLDMIRDNYPGIYFEYSENTTIDKIKKRLASLDRRSVVLLLAFFNDSTGTFFTYEKLMSEIYPVTPVPVYAVSINLLGMGITGGVVNSFEIQGREASRIAGLILGGIKPADIPAVRDVELKTVFDYREMKRFGIKKSLLPAGSTVINEPWGFYDFYHENMVLFLLLITVSFLAVIIVLAAGRNRILKINSERQKIIGELSSALDEVKALQGLLPICANCKNIRNDDGYWEQIETYVSDHSGVVFTHSLCPDCVKKLYPGINYNK